MTYVTPLPGEELPAGRPQRTSLLYERLKAKGGVFTETFGWERPKWYSLDGREEHYSYHHNNVFETVRDECLAVRERVGILDLSGFAKYDVSGADAEIFLNRLCANRMPARIGGIVLAHILSSNGRILGEVTVTRFADDRFYILSAAGAELRDLDHLQQGRLDGEDVVIENVTDDRGVLVLAGPQARNLLSTLTDAGLGNEKFRWLTGQEIEIAGVPARALRVNYVGELGWELHPAMQDLPALYEALWTAGEDFGIADFGLYAVNSLRIEKGYRGWGAELTNEVTMLDADMERFLKLDKDEFTGKEATLLQQDLERSLQLIYFDVELDGSDIRGNEPIFHNGECVGIATSGGYGHSVKNALGFGYVTPALSAPGTELEIGVLGERCKANILDVPAYDPANERLRG